jgi:hypothetical protein
LDRFGFTNGPTTKPRKKAPKTMQKRQNFKKFITKLNLKIFSKSQRPHSKTPKNRYIHFPQPNQLKILASTTYFSRLRLVSEPISRYLVNPSAHFTSRNP